jgi:hypothetical protein
MAMLSPVPSTDLTAATAQTLQQVAGLPVTTAITQADVLKQIPAELSVGSLDTTQVTGLMAQASASVGQAFDAISLDKGIGQFGFSPSQLENSGFLKPGTVSQFLQDPSQLETVLKSPSVWTGKSGVENLGSLLSNPSLQSITQNEIMITGLEGLKSAGIVTGRESPTQLASFVQTAAKFGVSETVAWVQGQASPDLVSLINATARDAQYAVNLVDTKLGEFNTGIRIGGFTGTVERSAVDLAVSQVIDNPKVPLPVYADSSVSSVSTISLLDQANLLRRQLEEAQRRYEQVLAASGNNRSAPEVEAAFREFESARARYADVVNRL